MQLSLCSVRNTTLPQFNGISRLYLYESVKTRMNLCMCHIGTAVVIDLVLLTIPVDGGKLVLGARFTISLLISTS